MTYRKLQVYFFLAVFALTLVVAFLVFRPYLGLMVFSGVLAVLMQPVYRYLCRHFRKNATLAAFSTVFLTLMLVLLPLLFMTAALTSEAFLLFNQVRSHVSFDDLANALSKILGPGQAQAIAEEASRVVSDLATYVQPFVSSVTSNIFATFSNTFEFIIGFVLLLLGLFYLLRDGSELKRQVLGLSLLADEDDTSILDRIIDAIKAVAFGQFVIALLKGVIGSLIFFALGLPAPIFWGTMVALTNFIPGVGTALVTVPFIVYLFAVGRMWSGLALSAVSILAIGLVDNFLLPHVMHSRIKIHPMLVLLSMLGGIRFFGAFGLFFGPITLSIAIALIDIYKKEFRTSVEQLNGE